MTREAEQQYDAEMRRERVREYAAASATVMKVAILEARKAGLDDLATRLTRLREDWQRDVARLVR